MRKFFKKLISTAIALAMTVSMSATFFANGTEEQTEDFRLADSMFKTTVVSSDNGGASTYSLNNNDTVSVNLTLSDGSETIESFVATDTNGELLSYEISEDSTSVQIDGLELDELYVFEAIVSGSSIRGGVETFYWNETIVAATDIYDYTDLELYSSFNSDISLCSQGTAEPIVETVDTSSSNVIELDKRTIVKGLVHSTADSDEYEFIVESEGCVDFKLLVPDTVSGQITMNIYEYENNNYYHRIRCNLPNTGDEFGRISFSLKDTVYRIKIDSVGVNIGSAYYLQIENNETKAWFPQAKGEDRMSTTYYWNTNKLDLLYYPTDLQNPFTDNQSLGSDKMSLGCSMAACAMVFANMGARTSTQKIDFRLSADDNLNGVQYYTNNLTPDPYTVFLSNNNLTGQVTYQNSKYILQGSLFSMSAKWDVLASRFAIINDSQSSNISYSMHTFSSSEKNELGLLLKLNGILSSNPNALSNGVLLRYVTGEDRGHTIVITYEY